MDDVLSAMELALDEQVAKWIKERDALVASAARIDVLNRLIAEAQTEKESLRTRKLTRGE
jgi:hypothetical protein